VSPFDADKDEAEGGKADNGGGPARPPNKRARQKAETRQRLLDAAAEVFLESPPLTASLDEVAARAGVLRPTLFFHFGSRAELMAELLRHHLEQFRTRARRFRPGELEPYIEAYLRSQRSHMVRLLWRLSDVVYLEDPEGPDLAFLDLLDELERRLASAGMSDGEAHQRALVLAYAMNSMARRVAFDHATDAEIKDFLDAAGALAAVRVER
jgi:AcrR family transcriptional regulator